MSRPWTVRLDPMTERRLRDALRAIELAETALTKWVEAKRRVSPGPAEQDVDTGLDLLDDTDGDLDSIHVTLEEILRRLEA